MHILIQEILETNNLKSHDWARKPRAEFLGCTVYSFISKLILYETGAIFIKNEGWGSQTFNRVINTLLVPIFGNISGGNQTWARILLQSIEIKKCPHCSDYKKYSEYTKSVHNFADIDSVCKLCKSLKNKTNYTINKDNYHKKYIDEHRSEYNARSAKRRAIQVSAIPKWADLDMIKEIYACCPEGSHVDHIIPLQGELVCGLHVETNLQYLTVEENLKKGNRYLV